MLYQVSHASKSFGADSVFEDVQFEIKGTEKVTIVGRNGCGKTTFLRCMCGEMDFDSGTVSRMNGVTIGYLAQKPLSDDNLTVDQELRAVFEPVLAMEHEMHDLEERMKTDSSEKLLSRYAELQEKFEAVNGYSWESEMMTVFTKFGFAPEEIHRKIGEFSGGQKTRIAFVKLLLSKPDILLLDEPTNHLDMETIEWLEGYVKNYPKAVVMVSHDRMFLDHTADVVYDMEYGKMTRYVGNYSSFVVQKKNNLERQEQAYERQQKDIQRLQELIEKFRYKKNKASFAQSKIKYLDRMEKLDPVQKADMKTFHAHFTPRIKGGEKVLETDHLKIGYDHPLTEVSMSMRRGDRIAIIGPNGCGKSTFVKTLMELIPSLGGSFLWGHQIEKGYFDQQLAQFSSGKTVLEELWDENPDLDRTQVRSVLGQFLFSADEVFKTVDVLSGGEKVRLSFAKLLLQHSNVLILDEPTNHLDIDSREILEGAVRAYEGTVLYVSHDRYFINRTATRILDLTHRQLLNYIGNYDYYLEKKDAVEAASLGAEAVDSSVSGLPTEAKKDWKAQKEEEARKRKRENDLRKTEARIDALETESSKLDTKFSDPAIATDVAELTKLSKQKDAVEKELEDLYARWEELQED